MRRAVAKGVEDGKEAGRWVQRSARCREKTKREPVRRTEGRGVEDGKEAGRCVMRSARSRGCLQRGDVVSIQAGR